MQAVTAHTNTNTVRTAKSVRAIKNIGPCLYIRSIHTVKITISITCHGVVRADKDRVLLDEASRSDAVEPVRPFENADVAVFDEVTRVLEGTDWFYCVAQDRFIQQDPTFVCPDNPVTGDRNRYFNGMYTSYIQTRSDIFSSPDTFSRSYGVCVCVCCNCLHRL